MIISASGLIQVMNISLMDCWKKLNSSFFCRPFPGYQLF